MGGYGALGRDRGLCAVLWKMGYGGAVYAPSYLEVFF